MKPVVLHSKAAADIKAAVEYLDGKQPGLGDEFSDDVEDAIRAIGLRPKAASPYPGGYRKLFLGRRFPYSIFYIEYDNCVWVAAVHHAHREPDTWKDRTPE